MTPRRSRGTTTVARCRSAVAAGAHSTIRRTGRLADVERDLIRVWPGEGRERAKVRGVKMGRKPKLPPHQKQEILRRKENGEAVREIARNYNVSHTTISKLAA
jgi:DNA invertase Pin-like site-specific DNA recombinase